MRVTPRSLPVTFGLVAAMAAAGWAQTLTLTPDHADGRYAAGAAVTWRIEVKGAGAAAVSYVVKQGGLKEIAKGKAPLRDGQGEIASKLDVPGTLLVEASMPGATGGTVRALSGAAFSPEKIQPSAPRPADFDAFWKEKLAELAAVPTNAVLTPVDSGKPGVDYWQIAMDNIRGTHIHGQLARPKAGERLPAMLIVQWAGVYGLKTNWVTDRAAEGWLALNIIAHDLPIDRPDAFYKEQANGPIKEYTGIGNDSREKSYFLRMYLSCYRAADYLANRPDWNGKTLVVTGGSQGGLQTFVTAALNPHITAGLANVPAGCDMLGPEVGRQPGWPMWYFKAGTKDSKAVREASRYYDVVNFASRITCPMLVGMGLIDQTCPPAGVFAAVNHLAGPKEVVLMTRSGHKEIDHSQAAYYARFGAWAAALRQGHPAPLKP